MLRALCFLTLLFVLGAIGLFVLQNHETITLQYLDRSVACSPWLLIAIVYVLGMVSGWTVLGFARRSIRRVTERPSS